MISAWAKLNLFLAIGNRQSDGYHPLVSLFQTITLKDDLSFHPHDDQSDMVFHVDYDPGLPDTEVLAWDSRNTMYRVVQAMIELGIEIPNGRIELFKRIPMQSGLGGGSADAAAFILQIEKIVQIPSKTRWQLAKSVGSDVPFLLRGGTAFVTGGGEKVSTLPPLPKCPVLLVRPPGGFSTPVMYSQLDHHRVTTSRKVDLFQDEREAMDLYHRLRLQKRCAFRNDFLDVVRGINPDTDEWFDEWEGFQEPQMILKGMTGSGSVCFAVFTTQTPSERIEGMCQQWRSRGFWSATAFLSGEVDIDTF